MNVNKAIIVGRVTQDIEMKTTTTGKNVVSFGVATNSFYKDAGGNRQETTEFHNVVLWGKLAEIANQYIVKGQEIFIEGRLQTRSWQGKDGNNRYTTEIVGEKMEMGQKPGVNDGHGSSSVEKPPLPENEIVNEPVVSLKSNKKKVATDDVDEEIKVEDIPF